MPKMKLFLVLMLLAWMFLSHEALSNDCTWVGRPVLSEIPEFTDEWLRMFGTYDKSDGSIALFIYWWNGHYVEAWKFKDSRWTKEWEGSMDIGDPFCHYVEIQNIYYDDNIGSIVLWAYGTTMAPESGCNSLLRYIPGGGFEKLIDIAVDSWAPVSYVAFDINRKRAVFAGSFMKIIDEEGRFVTVEYDGSNLYYVPNSIDNSVTFEDGKVGYDPNTQKVVFQGRRIISWPLETWEYDGQSWTLADTGIGPNEKDWLPGMIFVPELGGLLALEDKGDLMNYWIYRSSHWSKLEIAGQLQSYYDASLAMDSEMHLPVLFGGWDIHGYFSNKVWELQCTIGHNRPVSPP